ncbi:hypothetical protein ACEUDE_05645 [Aeromonas veronii]|jgi:hypothetical protein|uniref:hypothetical protein n=1 Tax=Aeromonas TaxID=642 RepID=UPI0011ECD86B|nr:hypothetical protein [Aeromonas sp. QDB21]MBO0503954.1 hypothetical protein [Aeromonas veronii]HEH9411143.1 hypothetical protein [Aeromonas salmonicida]
MRVAFIAALVLLSGSVSADCIGTDNFKTCYDDSGNTYTVQKFGNSTYVNGQNPSTGSSWNQQSQRIGNSTYTTGQDADGNSWSSTSTRVGNSTITNGIDSDGNAFSQTCNKYGCY